MSKLTADELKAIENRFVNETPSILDIPKLLTHIQTLEAQVKSLIGVMEKAQSYMANAPVNVLPINHPFWVEMAETLSTLPQLEQYRKEREALSAIQKLVQKGGHYLGCHYYRNEESGVCDCGFDEAENAVSQLQEKA